jgi:hypothetical protein
MQLDGPGKVPDEPCEVPSSPVSPWLRQLESMADRGFTGMVVEDEILRGGGGQCVAALGSYKHRGKVLAADGSARSWLAAGSRHLSQSARDTA